MKNLPNYQCEAYVSWACTSQAYIGVNFIDMHLMSVHIIGVYFMGVYMEAKEKRGWHGLVWVA
jgi:hypothetical protein